jgi:hypothetical protein
MGRIDTLFKIERAINGLRVDERPRVRHEQIAPILARFGSVAAGGALPIHGKRSSDRTALTA